MAHVSSSTHAETIPFRLGERPDIRRLEPYLRAHLPETDGTFSVGQFGGGYANLTYLCRFGETEYVLRRPPLGPIAPGAHDMQREHRVLAGLSAAFPLAPSSYHYCADPSIIGAPFHVMERRRGMVIRKTTPREMRFSAEQNRRVGEMLTDILADFHAVDPAAIGLGDLGNPEGFLARQVANWRKRWDAARNADAPALERVIAWLERTMPEMQRTCLLHNDYRLDNIIVEFEDPARAVAVLDWDMATIGDPLMDLGSLLAQWVQPDDPEPWIRDAEMPTCVLGFPSRSQVVDRYAERSRCDVSRIDWYLAFGLMRLAVAMQQIFRRFQLGQTSDQRFAGFGDRVTSFATIAESVMTGAISYRA